MRKDTFLHGSWLQVWVGRAHSGAQEVPSVEPAISPVNVQTHTRNSGAAPQKRKVVSPNQVHPN